jgi:hypothetical protein
VIRVTVELVSAISGETEHLGTAIIANDGKGTDTSGDYTVSLSTRGWNARPWKSGRVEGFPRKRLGGWDLLYRALREIVGERNK